MISIRPGRRSFLGFILAAPFVAREALRQQPTPRTYSFASVEVWVAGMRIEPITAIDFAPLPRAQSDLQFRRRVRHRHRLRAWDGRQADSNRLSYDHPLNAQRALDELRAETADVDAAMLRYARAAGRAHAEYLDRMVAEAMARHGSVDIT